jgi:hypothetical protein
MCGIPPIKLKPARNRALVTLSRSDGFADEARRCLTGRSGGPARASDESVMAWSISISAGRPPLRRYGDQ